MAKITMDTSEYEAMKENKRLLEMSLEKERSLQDQIKQLNAEKIKALEDAKMKVVHINRTEITEYALIKQDPMYTMRNLQYLFSNNYMDLNDRYKLLYDAFFKTDRSISTSINDETTFIGLDEVKSKIKKDSEKSVLDKLSQLEKLENEKADILKLLESEKYQLKECNKSLSDSLNENKELKRLVDLFEKMKSNIRNSINNNVGFFGRKKVIESIKLLVS